jgi:hypothetical protein
VSNSLSAKETEFLRCTCGFLKTVIVKCADMEINVMKAFILSES